MSREARDFKIGLFILAAAALLVLGLLAFGGAQFFEASVTEETYVSGNVNGLEVGSPVTLRGVRVGKVTSLDFTWFPGSQPGFVRIRFEVRARAYPVRGKALRRFIQAQVHQGLRARVQSQGLVGTTLLALEYVNPAQFPEPNLPTAPERLYVPSAPSQFNQLLASMDQSLRKLARFDLEKLSSSIQRDLLTVNTLLRHVDQINFGQVGTNVETLSMELHGVSSDLRSLVQEVDSTVKRMELPKVTHDADSLLSHLQLTLQHLDAALDQVNSGSLNQTLANVRRASVELEETLRELKQYPAGFIFGNPPPPAKAVIPQTR